MVNASDAVGHKAPVYSLVIPIFNEEAVLPLLVRRIGMNGAPKQVENVASGSVTPFSVPATLAV